jgi:hypothetical protein
VAVRELTQAPPVLPYFEPAAWPVTGLARRWLAPIRQAAGVMAVLLAITALTAPPLSPSIRHDFPDPAVLVTPGGYYAFSTQSRYGDQVWHVPVQRAGSPQGGWTPLADALPVLPPWAVDGAAVWAPAVTARADGTYLLYFTVPARVGARCIGVATSPDPAGPYRPRPDPLVCEPENHDTIDPGTFIDTDGARYLLYTNGRTASTIWLRRLTPDGLAVDGAALALLTADRPEEAGVIEAPTLVHRPGRYLLLYSGNTFNSGRYFVNYATAVSPAGPFRKHPGALLSSAGPAGGLTDPGGQDVITSADQDYLVFHAYTAPGRRSTFITTLGWHPDGTPDVPVARAPEGSADPAAGPAGLRRRG